MELPLNVLAKGMGRAATKMRQTKGTAQKLQKKGAKMLMTYSKSKKK